MLHCPLWTHPAALGISQGPVLYEEEKEGEGCCKQKWPPLAPFWGPEARLLISMLFGPELGM